MNISKVKSPLYIHYVPTLTARCTLSGPYDLLRVLADCQELADRLSKLLKTDHLKCSLL